MPDLSSSLSTIRSAQYRRRAWLAVFGTETLAEADVDGITGDPVTSLTVTFTSGAYTDVYRNSEVEVFTSGGVSKGRLRIRPTGTLDATTVPVAEVSDATVNLTTNDSLKFYNDFRLRPKLPAANATFDPDLITYTNQNTLLKPIVVSGGPVAQWVDDGLSYATIAFSASRSFTTDPDSGGTKTYAWTFPSGSTPTSSTSAAPTVQIPVGDHIVELVVTDSSNSATQTQYIPVRVFNNANPPIPIVINSLDGEETIGWSLNFTPLQAQTLSAVPDGARIAIFFDEFYGSTNASYGNVDSNRSQMKYVGWLRRDTSNTTFIRQTQQFECISNMERLGDLNGYSQVFIDEPAADEWTEIDQLTVNIAMYQILRWYTTALEIMDVIIDNTDYEYPRFYLQANTPLLQLRELADSIDCNIVCSRNGELNINIRLDLTPVGDRTSIDTILTLAAQDIAEIEVSREHWRPVGLLEVRGITQLGTSYFSRYPGSAFGDGSQSIVQDRIITTDQTELNTRAGLRGASTDRIYQTTTGQLYHAPFVRLTLRGGFDVFDFYREWIEIDDDGTYNRRGTDLTVFRFILKRVTTTNEKGTGQVRLELQAETAGKASDTYIPPPDDVPDVPPYNPTPVPPYDPPDIPDNDEHYPDEEGAGSVNAAAIFRDGHIDTTGDFETTSAEGGPTWTDHDHSASISGIVLKWTLDASSSYYAGTGTAIGGWLCTTTNIYYIDDVFSATPTITNQYTFATASSFRNMDADYIFDIGQFLVVVSAYNASPNTYSYMYSTDGGITWSSETAVGDAATLGPVRAPGLHVSTANEKTAYFWTNDGTSLSSDNHMRKLTVNGGATVDSLDPVDNRGLGEGLHFHFGDVDDRYAFHAYDDGSIKTIHRTDILSGVATDIGALGASDYIGIDPIDGKFVISSALKNANALMITDGVENRMFFTSNCWATPVQWVEATTPSTRAYGNCQLTSSGARAYFWGASANVAYWNGSTVDPRTVTSHSATIRGLVIKL